MSQVENKNEKVKLVESDCCKIETVSLIICSWSSYFHSKMKHEFDCREDETKIERFINKRAWYSLGYNNNNNNNQSSGPLLGAAKAWVGLLSSGNTAYL